MGRENLRGLRRPDSVAALAGPGLGEVVVLQRCLPQDFQGPAGRFIGERFECAGFLSFENE
jgi:hypothetical protein